jgi:hypothetical protein
MKDAKRKNDPIGSSVTTTIRRGLSMFWYGSGAFMMCRVFL